ATSPSLVLDPTARASVVQVFASIFPGAAPVRPALPAALAELAPQRPWWEGYRYHAVFSLRYGAGLVSALVLPVALGWAVVLRRPLPLVAALFALAYYLVNGVSPMILSRYMTPIIPALAVCEAGLVVAVAARAGARRTLAAVALTALLVAEPLAAAAAQD